MPQYKLVGSTNVEMIHLDFTKVFDKVDHCILCHILGQLGITDDTGVSSYRFLTDMYQFVSCNSSLRPIAGGVLHGTVLGPLLFLILMYDIDASVASDIVSFC